MRNSTPLLCYVDLLAETEPTSTDVKGECSGEPGDYIVLLTRENFYSLDVFLSWHPKENFASTVRNM